MTKDNQKITEISQGFNLHISLTWFAGMANLAQRMNNHSLVELIRSGENVPADIEPEATELATAFHHTANPKIIEKITALYQKIIPVAAGKIYRKIGGIMEMADLISYGYIGVLDALNKYDPDKGVLFKTYTYTKINGAILDGVRKMYLRRDYYLRKKLKEAEEFREVYILEHNRVPGFDDYKEWWIGEGHAKEHFRRFWVLDLNGGAVKSYDAEIDDDGTTGSQFIEDCCVEDPSQALLDEEFKTLFHKDLNDLPERERKLVELYYFQGVQMNDIAQIIGVSESRVSQLNKMITDPKNSKYFLRVKREV